MKKRLLYIVIGTAVVLAGALAYLRLIAVPIHAFDHSWRRDRQIAVDANIRHFAQRAQFDGYVSGISPIGRGKLVLLSSSRCDSGYHLFFNPTWVSDTLVVYRFTGDGKALWKTCTWTGT